MNPNDPWAIPPLPTEGEDTQEELFTSVGRALSQWEHFEGLLALIFTHFVGLHTDSPAARRAYGSVVSFRGRSDMLKSAAEAYFETHPDLEIAESFSRILKSASQASPRRNDIAHGIVQAYSADNKLSSRVIGYFLVPGYYNSNKRSVEGAPKYALSAGHINRFARQFEEMANPVGELLLAIVGKHQAQRAGRLPPSQRSTASQSDQEAGPQPPSASRE